MDGQTASTILPAGPDSDVMSAASFGGSDGNSDYVKLAKNSPTSLANTTDLEGNISKLETMKDILEGDINSIV